MATWIEPTEDQIDKMRKEWNSLAGDYYESGGPGMKEHVDMINIHIGRKHWRDVYRMLCEIGADETALKLTE